MVARHRAAIERQRDELDRARRDLEERMANTRARLDEARAQFERAVRRGEDSFAAARKYRDICGGWPERSRRPRPRRLDDGSEPIPVEPRPRPTPLIGGAEAPID